MYGIHMTQISTGQEVTIRHEQGTEQGTVLGVQFATPGSRVPTHVRVQFQDRTISTWPLSAVR